MASLTSIPPLPSSWPFKIRGAGPEFEVRSLVEVPGFIGAWHLVAPKELVLPDESKEATGTFGRGTLRIAGDIVIRPYMRGGLVRHFDEKLYFGPGRFQTELTVHRTLWAAGFPTVEPLGYGYRRRLWGVEGLYCTRMHAGKPWPACWEASETVIPKLEVMLEALCAWGLWAPDLNATNVLVAPDGEVACLDWDRAKWVGGDLMTRYRARLTRSLKKLGAPAEVVATFAGR